MRPGSSAVNGLREALVALKPAGPWRARAVVAEPQIQQCVSLQAESFLNREADPAPQVDRMAQRLRDGVVLATGLQDAFEPAPAGSLERFEHNGELVALVGTHFRRAMDGSSIAVFDPFFVTPVGSSDAVVRGIVADREHAARAPAAARAYVTVWGPESHLALALQGLEYEAGRHKWWKGITRSYRRGDSAM